MSGLDLNVLREVPITMFDQNVLRTILKSGGESSIWPAQMKPEVRAMLANTVSKGLIAATFADGERKGEIADVCNTGERTILRFTDFGRRVLEQDQLAMKKAGIAGAVT